MCEWLNCESPSVTDSYAAAMEEIEWRAGDTGVWGGDG